MTKHGGNHLRGAREHAFSLFQRAANQHTLGYHDFARTREVVAACKEIAKGSALGCEARDVASLCAWFWDTCYTSGSDDHATSLALCLDFLAQQQADHASGGQIAACFGGARSSARPAPAPGAAVEEASAADVLHDARLAVLAERDYVERIELLRFELQRRSGKMFTDVEWTQHCIAFLGANPYRTRFAQRAFGSGRAANMARLQTLLRKQLREERERADDQSDVAKKGARGAESLYYHFTRIQLGLTSIADHRTSTMIHVNAIMMSLVLALLARRIEAEPDLLAPTVFLLLVNLAVVFISINSMRAAKERLSEAEARLRDANVISVSNDTRLSLAEFTGQMEQLIADPRQFQRKVLEHLYFARVISHQRSKALRLTYRVFLYGITIAVIGFVVVMARR